MKISWKHSSAPRRAAASGVRSPFSTALARSFSGSMPPPSSRISMATASPSWRAESSTWPIGFLPAASRTDGRSMPWSMALRTRCTSGSASASTRLRSSSVSAPSSVNSTCLSSWRATSRAIFGKRWNTRLTGCMRVRITEPCRRAVAWSSAVTARWRSSSLSLSRSTFSRLRASTSSPVRLTMASSRFVSTRTVCSVSPPVLAGAAGLALALGAAFEATALAGLVVAWPEAQALIAAIRSGSAGSRGWPAPSAAICAARVSWQRCA